jgi:hypothetical protein
MSASTHCNKGTRMYPVKHLLAAAALSLLSASTFAATTVYTSSAAFLPQVAAGSYFNSFTGLADPAAGPVTFSGSGFSFAASAPSDLILTPGFLSTSQIDEALTINFTSGNVTAFGGNFFAVDFNNTFQAVSLTLTLSDGKVETFTPSSLSNSYRGFVSTSPITSLVISAPGQSLYGSLDNFTVGQTLPVPEPGTLSLWALGVAGLMAVRRHRQA